MTSISRGAMAQVAEAQAFVNRQAAIYRQHRNQHALSAMNMQTAVRILADVPRISTPRQLHIDLTAAAAAVVQAQMAYARLADRVVELAHDAAVAVEE